MMNIFTNTVMDDMFLFFSLNFRVILSLPKNIVYRYPKSISRTYADMHGRDETNPNFNK